MQREIAEMKAALAAYIEATYHISNSTTVKIRRQLLDRLEGIAQEPYVESTPAYVGKRTFDSLRICEPVRNFFSLLATPESGSLLFDPPYEHQARALELSQSATAGGTGIVVTTGTGSGKTEAFLLPVLARLAEEATNRPDHFEERGVRCLLLYPMNALVNDQLGRLRNLLGNEQVREWFAAAGGRPVKFGRYTGRSLYPGRRTAERDKRKLASLRFYLDLEDAARAGDAATIELVDNLKRRGRWPSKADSRVGATDGLRNWFGTRNQRWEDDLGNPLRAIERPEDSELLSRHEMQLLGPDLLVTNYSMLEYMLLRPIERSILDESRRYFEKCPDEKFVFILDESHLYRGANGTEVAYLIRRFLDRLRLPLSRVQFICTSASFSDPAAARHFAAQLTGLDAAKIVVLGGEKRIVPGARPAACEVASVFAECDLRHLASADTRVRVKTIVPLLKWAPLDSRPRFWLEPMAKVMPGRVEVFGLGPDGQIIGEVVQIDRPGRVFLESNLAVVTDVRTEGHAVIFGREGAERTGEATGVGPTWVSDELAGAIWHYLHKLDVVALLINVTSGAQADATSDLIRGAAKSISELSRILFIGAEAEAALHATDVLLELASMAKKSSDQPPLLPARVHLMFRGLPGVWACIDPSCTALDENLRGGPTGALFAEPRRHCDCGAQVFELHTCRSCGLAIANAFAGSPAGAQHFWPNDGANYGGEDNPLRPAHLCLESPHTNAMNNAGASPAFLDVLTARLDGDGERVREIWHTPGLPGRFGNCPRCNDKGDQISDLQTKGEEPFQQLVAVQVLEQAPRPESRAPLKGRKALVFSDGRQTASRLAGVMKTFAFRDSLRPLLIDGMAELGTTSHKPTLDDAPMAAALSAAIHGVRLRPVGDDGFFAECGRKAKALLEDTESESDEISELSLTTSAGTPTSVFENLYALLQDKHTGLSALALGSVTSRLRRGDLQDLAQLVPPAIDSLSPEDARKAVVDLWLWSGLQSRSIKISSTPSDLEGRFGANSLATWNGKFKSSLRDAIGKAGFAAWLNQFESQGLPILRRIFALQDTATFQISARKVSLVSGDQLVWRRCDVCTLVSPQSPLLEGRCPVCPGTTRQIDPLDDQVFRSRKSFFRRSTERLLAHQEEYAPHQLVAEEHSAQLNDTSSVKAISRNEAYELRFQDVPIRVEGEAGDPIDVLSCTTTMEVGIDIGGLTAVALRNVPPGRANYQQRAGRAGRRGAGLSTVMMFCGADSHDQSFFRDPGPIVAGPAPDPVLNLENPVIAERQAYAFLLGRFQQARITGVESANIFESLGLTRDFLNGAPEGFSLAGLKQWIVENQDGLVADLDRLFVAWCPALRSSELLTQWPRLLEEKLGAREIEPEGGHDRQAVDQDDDMDEFDDADDNDRTVASSTKLLDQLFALGLMPRYAFPTDVATFAVFEDDEPSFAPSLRYSPQQSLNAALAQYAPGHDVWIDSQRHVSLGIWSAFEQERRSAYADSKLYFHCQICDYAVLQNKDDGASLGETKDCPACLTPGGMGPAQRWIRPVGFSHPPGMAPAPPRLEGTTNSRPTRAKLEAPHFQPTQRVGGKSWPIGSGWEAWRDNLELVVTNRGTQSSLAQGFRYCDFCGRTEPADLDPAIRQLGQNAAPHDRPRPRRFYESESCSGRTAHIVIGNKFKTDIAVFRLQPPEPWDLDPNRVATTIAAKSAVEALVQAASTDLEPGDIDGDYRFAPGGGGIGFLDLYIYDQAAGGAGFVKAAASRPELLVERALAVLDCDCEDSCYQCLRSYKNRFDHAYLDRRLGADLLKACFLGIPPQVDGAWMDRALAKLCEDINDTGAAFEVSSGGLRAVDGSRAIILSHPLIPNVPGNKSADKFAAEHGDVIAIDILLVDRSLPLATDKALERSAAVVRRLQPSDGGAPLLSPDQILSPKATDVPQKVDVGAFESGDFVMVVNAHTMDSNLGGVVPIPKGTPCLFRPITGTPDPKQFYLLSRTDSGHFGATNGKWTVGMIQPSNSGVRIRYRARPDRLECASEFIADPASVQALAVLVRPI